MLCIYICYVYVYILYISYICKDIYIYIHIDTYDICI